MSKAPALPLKSALARTQQQALYLAHAQDLNSLCKRLSTSAHPTVCIKTMEISSSAAWTKNRGLNSFLLSNALLQTYLRLVAHALMWQTMEWLITLAVAPSSIKRPNTLPQPLLPSKTVACATVPLVDAVCQHLLLSTRPRRFVPQTRLAQSASHVCSSLTPRPRRTLLLAQAAIPTQLSQQASSSEGNHSLDSKRPAANAETTLLEQTAHAAKQQLLYHYSQLLLHVLLELTWFPTQCAMSLVVTIPSSDATWLELMVSLRHTIEMYFRVTLLQ